MDLFEQTKLFIEGSVKRFYYKAIELGAPVSSVEYMGANIYKISVGNMELVYMGTVDGAARLIGSSGEVF